MSPDRSTFLVEARRSETSCRPTDSTLELLGERDIPCTPVNSLEDLFEDEHLADVGMFRRNVHPTEGEMVSVRSPFLSGVASEDRPAPSLGSDTCEILQELGYDPAEIADLTAGGVVARPVGPSEDQA